VAFPQDYHFQELADTRRNPVPEIGDEYEGPVTVETYTVFYGRNGTPTYGVVLARSPGGSRVVARVDTARAGADRLSHRGSVRACGHAWTNRATGRTTVF
jgi:acetyl-CoA C-acetyltransferase